MHAMELIREYEGIEEWLCPVCGRRLLVNWHPKFKRTVLSAGDQSVTHSGFKNHTRPDDMLEMQTDEVFTRSIEKPIEESRLIPWALWMDKSNFANLWND
jgi:hypothetical protein